MSARDDPDFYSMTESFSDETEKPFKCSDVVSNDSDLYHSPTKSIESSNFKTVNEANETDKIMLILGEKKIMTHDSFRHLDHRLKLHIEIYIFRKDEYINCCLQVIERIILKFIYFTFLHSNAIKIKNKKKKDFSKDYIVITLCKNIIKNITYKNT